MWIIISNKSYAQNIDTAIFKSITTIPNSATYKNTNCIIQELSGIDYTGVDNNYYIIPQSEDGAYYFIASIVFENNELKVDFIDKIDLIGSTLDAEAIRKHPKTNVIYIAEEQKLYSSIFSVSTTNELQLLIPEFEHNYNRGIEGLCFNADGSKLYASMESSNKMKNTSIYEINIISNKIVKEFKYPLHKIANDKNNDNGITEILCINDSTLLVLERAYLKSQKRNNIRLYRATIPRSTNRISEIKLLSDFSKIPNIDNIEGMTFNHDKSALIFVSDNNGNEKQKTQIIYMTINKE
ncbi:MAG: esterase-like activity of phytase family protein [Salinivirgaceae bacterium]|nr:esterase-like activity of phytase family protein [Salinivirgaceae bacterium]